MSSIGMPERRNVLCRNPKIAQTVIQVLKFNSARISIPFQRAPYPGSGRVIICVIRKLLQGNICVSRVLSIVFALDFTKIVYQSREVKNLIITCYGIIYCVRR